MNAILDLDYSTPLPPIWDLFSTFSEHHQSKAWKYYNNGTVVEANNEYHRFIWTRRLHLHTFKKLIQNPSCTVCIDKTCKHTHSTYTAWILAEPPRADVWLYLIQDAPELLPHVAIYDLSQVCLLPSSLFLAPHSHVQTGSFLRKGPIGKKIALGPLGKLFEKTSSRRSLKGELRRAILSSMKEIIGENFSQLKEKLPDDQTQMDLWFQIAHANSILSLLSDSKAQGLSLKVLKECPFWVPKIESLKVLYRFDPPKAIAKAVAIIQANPDIVAALSTTGGGPTTWAGAQQETGVDLVAIGMDYTRVNLDLVKDGEMYAVVGQPLWDESYEAAKLLQAMAAGEEVPYWTEMDAPIITADDVEQYVTMLDDAEAMMKE